MAPLRKAITIQSLQSGLLSEQEDEKLYGGSVDPDWSIGSVPNGGYVLGLVLEACIQFQSSSPHVDPLYITAHYIKTTISAPFTVRVRNIKIGTGFTNLTANLIQEGVVRLMTHMIFGVIAAHSKDHLNLNLNPPSTYARRLPLYTHPSEAKVIPMRPHWKFNKLVKWTDEEAISAKNDVDSLNRTNSSTVGGGGLEWGTWFEFNDKDEKITTPYLPLLLDMFLNTPTLLPKSERVGLTTSWYPTMTMTIEFKNRIPPPSPIHAARTVGIYSLGRFIMPPKGRHDIYCEVWTAPSNIGEGNPAQNWRDEQVCLAIATQMALVVPMEVNDKKGGNVSVKL